MDLEIVTEYHALMTSLMAYFLMTKMGGIMYIPIHHMHTHQSSLLPPTTIATTHTHTHTVVVSSTTLKFSSLKFHGSNLFQCFQHQLQNYLSHRVLSLVNYFIKELKTPCLRNFCLLRLPAPRTEIATCHKQMCFTKNGWSYCVGRVLNDASCQQGWPRLKALEGITRKLTAAEKLN